MAAQDILPGLVGLSSSHSVSRVDFLVSGHCVSLPNRTMQ